MHCTYFNYNQDECRENITDGYFLNDTRLRTIDKCHTKCKTCKIGPIGDKENCLICKDNSTYLYLNNCLEACPINISYIELGIKKCKCEIEECKECTDESLKEGLCITCYDGYYPKINDNYNYTKCYKDPPKYYLDEGKKIYKPCYPSCETCNGEGNDYFHNCIICESNHTFTLKNKDKNCYENCRYYYYFDNENKYRCTEKDECPNDFKYLIAELKQCVRLCSDTEYKTKFSYG